MKKFLLRLVVILCLLVISDFFFGGIMGYVSSRVDCGTTGRANYICNKVNDDILIFGSSRAEHHYNSSMISDSLGLSCYNCGERGSGVVLNYGRMLMLLQRHTPKLIVYDINADYDLLGHDSQSDLGSLKRYYDRDGIDSLFWKVDPTSKYKMISGFYRYNTTFLIDMAFYVLHTSRSGEGVNGFRPLDVSFDEMKVKRDVNLLYDDLVGKEYDSIKWYYMQAFLKKTKDVKCVFVVSPVWYGQNAEVLKDLRDKCDELDILFLDYSNDPKYVHNNEYFQDGTHLNHVGANEFTNDLIKQLKALVINN